MKVLELFSGTHSIGKVCKKKGFEIVSLDRDMGAKCPFGGDYESENHIMKDIMEWDYKSDFKVGEFDLITASPVCLWWSLLRNSWIGRKLKGMKRDLTKEDIENDILKFGVPMVDKVFEIIDYFKPQFYWIENPATGRMKEYISPLIPFYDIDYCKYGMPYKKTTRIWTNIEGFIPKRCKNDCDSIVEIKTQKGDIHTQSKKQIQSPTRKLHEGVISYKKQKAILRHKEQLGHTLVVGQKKKRSSNIERYIIPEPLVEELVDITYKHKNIISDFGGGSDRRMRYRIPEPLIEDLFSNITI